MSRPGSGPKRKRDDVRSQSESRKRRAIQNSDSASHDLEQLEKSVAEDPSKNRKDVQTLLRMFDFATPDAKINLKVGVALCKVFTRLVASGNLMKDGHRGSKQNQELSDWYAREYGEYRRTLVKLLRSASASQRLPNLHLCWRVLEQDAELLDNSVWVSDSIFEPLLSAIIEIPDGADVRNTYVGEYVNPCHDCCYHSLEFFSYVCRLSSLWRF
jgi:U3 small nucleolar RNA-associated protein 19